MTVNGKGIAAARAEESAEPVRPAAGPIERESLPVFQAIVTIGAWAFFRFMRLGIAMRAVAANEGAAMLMGIEVSRIHMIAWGLSAAIAALAGVLFAALFKLGPTIWFEAQG